MRHNDRAGLRCDRRSGQPRIDLECVRFNIHQARVRPGSTVVSTSTRNFPNRLGIDTRVYLSSAELAAVCALMGKIPTVAEYMEQVKTLESKAADVYRFETAVKAGQSATYTVAEERNEGASVTISNSPVSRST